MATPATPNLADRLTSSELDSMRKSLESMTDLSKQLRVQFNLIKNTTDLTSDAFKDIVSAAKTNSNIAEKYLITQKTSNILSEKINELKSKSGYLDSIGLKFKQQELLLQKQITTAQISGLLKSNALDAAAKKEAIDALNVKMILADEELDYLDKHNTLNNSIVTSLNDQLVISDGILDNIQLMNNGVIDMNSATSALKGSFNFLFGKTGLIVKDLGKLGDSQFSGKLGEYLQYGVKPATLLVDILEQGYKNFLAFDKAAVSVRSNLGALPGQANQLESLIKQVGIESMHLGVTFDDVAKSINEITNEFTGLVAQDTDLLKITTALSKQFGIAEGTSVKFLKTLGGISGNSASSQRSMVGFAQKIAQAAGVPLGKIMQDVAEASDDVRIYVGSSAVSMIKAATAARMLGIDMNKAAATAEKLLQFESSIASELKASALLGQNVNFNYARRLFFNKNIIDGNKEILRITKQVNFNQLDPIKQKAYADAAGKSVGELQDMLQQEKNIQLVKNGTNEKAKKVLVDYERMMQLKDEEAKNEGKLAEKQILQMANQEKLAQLQNKFNQLMSELAKPVMDIVEPLLDLAIIVLPKLLDGFRILVGYSTMFSAFKFLMTLPRMVNAVLGALKGGQGIVMTFSAPFKALSRSFGPILKFLPALGKLGPLLAPIMKVAGPIGLIIAAIQSVFSIFDTVKSAIKDFTDGNFLTGIIKIFIAIPKAILDVTVGVLYDLSRLVLGWFGVDLPNGMWNGIKAVGDMLFEGMLKPFKGAWDWIKSIFVGNSPSELGLGIVRGIKSVGGMIQDSLITPVNKAYGEIKNISPPEIDVTGGFSSIGTELQDSLITSVNKAYEEIKNISPPEIDVTGGFSSISTELQDSLITSVNKAYEEIKNISPPKIDVVGKSLMNGFSSISTELQDSLITSVNKAYEEIKNISPPEINVTGGFSSIGTELQDSLITSVNKAYEEIKNISPPEINVVGKLIMNEFSSIGTELQDSLVTSVNKAYGEIKNISPPEINVVGKLIMNGFSSIGTELQDSLVTSVNKAYEEIKNISPPEIKVDSATTNKLVETTDNTLISVIKTSNQQLVAKLDQLITMMSNGGIAVNLDGQKIDKFVATSKIKSGGFGQATMG